MRDELELIEKIENYLKNRLSEPEMVLFEEEMAKNASLQKDVTLQKQLLQGIERLAWKQKIQQAGRRYKITRNLRNWGPAGFMIIILAALIIYYLGPNSARQRVFEGNIPLEYSRSQVLNTRTTKDSLGNTAPEHGKSHSGQWVSTDKNLPVQTFSLDAGRDTVIETRGGISISVPGNAFLDEDGNPATGQVDLILKEALDPASILRAGLSTSSGDQLLETGGMFFLDARKDGNALKIDPAHGIYAEIPADSIKPGMKLYTGHRLADGTIDWLDPQPLEHILMPVDIHLLDFYPPHYLDSLASWGYDIHNKNFTDSLYYSFARIFGELKTATSIHPVEGKEKADSSVSDTVSSLDNQTRVQHRNPLCFLNPAKIKAIWNDEFQNTLLSTREFGERMPWIHRSGNQAIMDLYVDNLDKDLSSIDSMVAALPVWDETTAPIRKQFLSFQARQDGKVRIGSKTLSRLKAWYEMKTQAYMQAVRKTQDEFWARQDRQDKDAQLKRSRRQIDSINDNEKNFDEELNLNLKSALSQLGYDTALPFRKPAKAIYAVTLTNTGWCNIDRAVYEATTDRTTLDYTDPQTGKKAVIKYSPVSFRVDNASAYDRIYLYLLPDKLSSFMRVPGSDGKFSDRLDELMNYRMVCIAYRNDQAFYYATENIQPKDYPPFVLKKIDGPDLDRKLETFGKSSQGKSLKKENVFIRFDIRDQIRQKHNAALRDLTEKIFKVIFPCIANASPASERPYIDYQAQ